MAITKDQAINSREFHATGVDDRARPNKSGIRCYVWRRNGQTKTWKTRPAEFQIPVKYGMYDHAYITHHDAEAVYTREECPVCNGLM